jgi:hypothetical protein
MLRLRVHREQDLLSVRVIGYPMISSVSIEAEAIVGPQPTVWYFAAVM